MGAEAYGAAYILQEMLTIKFDDTVGRVKAYEAMSRGENIARAFVPESFKVLLKEMQSLALDVNVVSRRASGPRCARRTTTSCGRQEPGIDLSGVGRRRTAADEATSTRASVEAFEEEVETGTRLIEPAKELEEEDFSTDEDSMIDEDVPSVRPRAA